jgi:hypothetical protein
MGRRSEVRDLQTPQRTQLGGAPFWDKSIREVMQTTPVSGGRVLFLAADGPLRWRSRDAQRRREVGGGAVPLLAEAALGLTVLLPPALPCTAVVPLPLRQTPALGGTTPAARIVDGGCGASLDGRIRGRRGMVRRDFAVDGRMAYAVMRHFSAGNPLQVLGECRRGRGVRMEKTKQEMNWGKFRARACVILSLGGRKLR